MPCIGFIIGQFLKTIPVLKSSGPQLSHGCIHFLFTLTFMYGMKQFSFFWCFQTNISVFRDNNFKMSITPFNFHQIQHPAPVLNAELQGLFETGIGIKIWPSIDGEITLET